jgi:protein involved in polysaccharide export with SLBB domain
MVPADSTLTNAPKRTRRGGVAGLSIAFLLALGQGACVHPSGPKFDPLAPFATTGTGEEAASGKVVPAEFVSAGARQSPSPDLLKAPPGEYRLGPGDKLDLEILDEPGTRAETFVTPDGMVYFDLIDAVEARGKTAPELKAALEEKLTRFYRDPRVSVTLVEAESQRFNLLGRVSAPGSYPLKKPTRLLEAIAMGGGLFASRFAGSTEELADLDHSFVIREGRALPVDFAALIRDGDLSQNIYLRDGDFVYLPSSLSNEVYVLGAVTAPRPVGFKGEMTLTAALGHGLGLQRTARLDRVSIIRGSFTDPRIAIVDAGAILKGAAPNVRLEPGDIVYLPGEDGISPKQITREAIDTFTRVVAANEGSSLGAGGGANPVNVNVPIGVASP